MARSRQATTNRYQYKTNRSVTGLEAQTVGEELERIREVRGELTPPAIVHESQPRTAVLHNAFEWNDATAAHEYRLHQARNIVSTVTVVRENTEGNEISVPGFVSISVPSEDEEDTEDEQETSRRQYLPVDEVISNQEFRAQALQTLRARLRNIRLEYQSFSELSRVWSAIDAECRD
jgi:hypothetical protein